MKACSDISEYASNPESVKSSGISGCLETIRAAIYVSHVSNQESYSLSEFEICRRYIEENGWFVCDLYLEKPCESGDNNPLFRLMLARAKSGCFDVLVILNHSMLSWSFSTFDKVSRFLDMHNVTLHLARVDASDQNHQVTWFQYTPLVLVNSML
ncbi:MAG: hypothetical protein ABSF44_06710 [Candidatus Bathyarchaeia archaeon]|jgi:DNA invertase Pin-like site-specific DNA recombinase